VSSAVVVAVAPGSPAERAGVLVGDELLAISGRPVRDVIEYRVLGDEAEVELDLVRDGAPLTVGVRKVAGVPLGVEVDSPVFDGVRTCDNHCEFCFIHQLPPGMRRSLHVKDDDYRLSFLYGNFTTLTRFTESDLERVVTEGLSPLYVSIHATAAEVRSDLLRNRRGGTSLRWLRALLDHGVEVHGQVVVCPEDTLAGILDQFPELTTVAVVPLGVSRYNHEPAMRPHTADEARHVVDIVGGWQQTMLDTLGRRVVHAADEYYLVAQYPFPAAEAYEGFPMHEDGIGMARTFELEFSGRVEVPTGPQSGFFSWVDGAPAAGYRAPRNPADSTALRPSPAPASGATTPVSMRPRRGAPVGVLTGEYGAQVISPLLASLRRDDIRVIPVRNDFFGGNTAVAGLLVAQDLVRVLSEQPEGHRYLLPDVCLSEGRFLDGGTVADLPRAVEVIPTDGIALRRALETS